jgi:hypothetical protein
MVLLYKYAFRWGNRNDTETQGIGCYFFFTKFQFERIVFFLKKELLLPPCCLAFDRCIHWPGKLQVRREGSAQFDQVNPTKVEHVSTQRA